MCDQCLCGDISKSLAKKKIPTKTQLTHIDGIVM